MKNIIALTNYNIWANKRIADWLLSNESKVMELNCKSSFTTIAKTINHIWDAQIFYLSILKQVPINKNWDKTTRSSINGLTEQSEEFAQYVSQLDLIEFNEPRTVEVKTLSGTFDQSQLIQHCMNHSTFHRGQIITIGHQLGLNKAPSTDMLFYFIQK